MTRRNDEITRAALANLYWLARSQGQPCDVAGCLHLAADLGYSLEEIETRSGPAEGVIGKIPGAVRRK